MPNLFFLLAEPLGIIMGLCYSLVGNVGVAIILFTIIVRVLMFPLSVKQHKTTAKSQIFTPKLTEIRKKYAGNQEKYREEMMKLQKQGFNPAGGCLPMIVTMLILFGVLGVVYGPMKHFEQISSDDISNIRQIAIKIEQENYLAEEGKTAEDADYKAIERDLNDIYRGELRIIGIYQKNAERFKESWTLTDGRVQLKDETIKKLDSLADNIFFLGINFSEVPGDAEKSWPIILIPILSFIFAAAHMIMMQIIQRKTMPEALAQMGAMKYMLYFMPILSLVIAFQFPAGAGFYWAISSAVMIVQTLLINQMYPPVKIKEAIKETLEKQGMKFDNVVVIEKHDGSKVEKKASQMSQNEKKDYYRKKLEEARKADLEKYGEVGAPPTVADEEKEE